MVCSRARRIVGHELGPAPLVAACVGFWMPLDWMLLGGNVLRGLTWWESCRVVALAALTNYLPAALLAALFIYLLAGAAALFPGMSFRRMVAWGIRSAALLVLLIVSVRVLKSVFLLGPMPAWQKYALVAFLGAGSLVWGGWSRREPAWLFLPRKIAWGVLPLAVLVLLGGLVGGRQHPVRGKADGARPNIFLVTVDTLSAGHLHSYGYGRATSPHIDAFASEATRFETAYANGNWTRPGVASLLNGVRPWIHGGDLGRPRRGVVEELNLLGRLAAAGYEVRTVSMNFYADRSWQGTTNFVARGSRVERALNLWPVFLNGLSRVDLAWMFGPGRDALDHIRLLFGGCSNPWNVLERTGICLDAPALGQPLCVWVHLLPPHDPYAAPRPYLGRFEGSAQARTWISSQARYGFLAGDSPDRQGLLEARYDESVLFADALVGRFLELLKARGLYDQSIVAVTADHGESFRPQYGAHGGPLLLEELIRIPCLIKGPGQRQGGVEVEPFEQADFAPTLLHMAGLPVPSGMEGLPYPLKPSGRPVFSMNRDCTPGSPKTFSVAMRQGAWKYVVHFGPWKHPWPQRELYDLVRDPGETANLVALRKEVAAPMHGRILEELARQGLKPEAP